MKTNGTANNAGGAGGAIVIGLTGGSGSGKSEAAKILAGLGARVIDADEVAHRAVEKPEALAELKGAFGAAVIDARGGFDRAAASELAFSDAAFLRRLTEVTHKYIIKDIYALVAGFKRAGSAPIVIDAPLPVEKGFLDVSDAVWVVRSPRRQRVARIVRRDGISEAAAEARLASQLPDAGYERLADVVIDNGGGVAELEAGVRRAYGELLGGAP